MNWASIKEATVKAATATTQIVQAINFNIDAIEYKCFGDLDAKADVLFDEWGNIIATKSRNAKDWTVSKFKETDNDIQR